MKITGAGGTSGGVGSFLLGLVMMCGGFYLLLHSIMIYIPFSLGAPLYYASAMGGMSITSGMLLIPLVFGVGMVFYNARNPLGWLLFVGALVAIIFGVLSNIQFSLRAMSLFDLLVILVLCVGGLGLFLRSLRNTSSHF
ncbi:hypothetical protein [Uliginosibacterium gangwonense]|uniref:hypothetical protein n=1 Tax=Uliginosibacterium gangwonense TaxID=392736 RepID=UPI000369FD19|nr:hypothetical protein [Uliginosibacterium gangwonense]